MEDYLSPAQEKPKMKRWSKEIRIDDTTKRIEVEQVSNGYIITITKDYKDETGNWKWDCAKKVSLTNPFEKSEDKEDDDGDFDSLMKSAEKLL